MSVRRWLGLVAAALVACSSAPRPPPPPSPPLATDAYSHYLRGRMAALEGDDATAAREFERAAAAAPEQAPIQVALIEALLGARRRGAAERVASRALKRWPERAEVHLAAGRVYRALRRYRPAIAVLTRAWRLTDSDEIAEDAVLELGSVYVAVEHPERAVAAYRELIRQRPDLTRPRYRLLALLVKTRRLAAAEAVGRELIELRPGHVKTRVLYSRALAGLGKKDEALATLRQAFERSGGRVDVGERLFEALLDAGQRREALSLLEILASSDLDDDDRLAVGRLFVRVGFFARAAAIAAEVLESPEAIELRATALAGMRQFERAAAAIAELGDSAGIAEIGYAAEMLAHAGKVKAALERLEQAPAHPHRAIARARVHELAGDRGAARRVLAEARKAWPRERDLIYARAVLELRAGEHERAAALARSLLRAEPESLQLKNLLGYILADGDLELERARRLLEAALEQAPDAPGILDSVGWLHYRRGDLGAAATHLYRALRLAPADAEILFHVGVLEKALGRRPAAARRLARALARAREPTLRSRIEREMVRSEP